MIRAVSKVRTPYQLAVWGNIVVFAKAKQRLEKLVKYVVFAKAKRRLEKLVKYLPFEAEKRKNMCFH